MSFDSIIDLSISLSTPPIALASFSVPLVLAVLTTPQGTAWTSLYGAALTVEVTPSTWTTVLTGLGVTTAEDLYLALTDMFAQDEQPSSVKIGRRATAVAMARRFTVGGTTDGTYTITINGTAHAFVAVSQTATQIRDALIVLLNAGAQGSRITATTNSTAAIDVTADVAGETFTDATASTGAAFSPATSTVTPNVGISTDIPLIRAYDDNWYHVLETTRTNASARMLAAAISGLRKYSWAQTLDAVAQTAPTTDIGSELGALSYIRTAVVWDDDDNDFVDFAWVGLMSTSPPGTASWAAKTLRSVTGIVATGESFLASKNYNWLERFPAGNFTMTRHGQSIDGTFIDIVIGRDWLYNLIQTRVIEAMRDVPKIPMDDRGRAMLKAAIRGALLEAADADLVDRSTIVVSVPLRSALPGADVTARHWSGITFGATLTGATHSVAIVGALAS